MTDRDAVLPAVIFCDAADMDETTRFVLLMMGGGFVPDTGVLLIPNELRRDTDG